MSMDRFNFRAILPIEYMDYETKTGVMYSIMVDVVAITQRNNVEVYNLDVACALDKLGLTETASALAKHALNNSATSIGDITTTFKPAAILQCVGIKDKRERLVFDGDIIQFQNSNMDKPEVWGFFKWDNQRCVWCINDMTSIGDDNFCGSPYHELVDNGIHDPNNIEVVGNIYDREAK